MSEKKYSEYYEKYGKYMVQASVDAEVLRNIKMESIRKERSQRSLLADVVSDFLNTDLEIPEDYEPPRVKAVNFNLSKEDHARLKLRSYDIGVPIYKIASYVINMHFSDPTATRKVKLKRRKAQCK